MTHSDHDTQAIQESQVPFEVMVKERLWEAVRAALITILEEEVTAFIGAKPYERTQTRRDQRTRHYTRDLETSVGPINELPVPRTLAGHQTQVFERYHRRQNEVDRAIGEMFVKGVSTSKVGEVMETLTGSHPSASSVSRVFHTLESEYQQWKQRPLAERYVYAFADGTYFTVIYQDEGCKMPILAAIGITPTGAREVLAFRPGERENQQAWEGLFDDVKARGVQTVGLWISDGGQAMLNAIKGKFASSKWQRCVVHKMENMHAYVPAKQREQMEPELKGIFIRKGDLKRTRHSQPLSKSIRRAIQPQWSVYSEMWRPVSPSTPSPKSIGRRFAPTM